MTIGVVGADKSVRAAESRHIHSKEVAVEAEEPKMWAPPLQGFEM